MVFLQQPKYSLLNPDIFHSVRHERQLLTCSHVHLLILKIDGFFSNLRQLDCDDTHIQNLLQVALLDFKYWRLVLRRIWSFSLDQSIIDVKSLNKKQSGI